MIIKDFVKNGNIDFETLFSRLLQYNLSNKELMRLGDRICYSMLSEDILLSLFTNTTEFDIFSTYELPPQTNELISQETIENNKAYRHTDKKKYVESPKTKRRNTNRVPPQFDSKSKQIRMSNMSHHKPTDPESAPNPVYIASEDEAEKMKLEAPKPQEEIKLSIPNEGNINKSPMSLFTKATRVSAFTSMPDTNNFFNSQGNIREKSHSFNHFPKIVDSKRSITPQQKNNFNSNFTETQRMNFGSVDHNPVSRMSQHLESGFLKNASKQYQRASTFKEANRAKIVKGSKLISKNPQQIGIIKQSPENPITSGREDFVIYTGEKKVSQKKSILPGNTNASKGYQNLNWNFDSKQKAANRFKQHLNKRKNAHKSNTYRSAPRNIVPTGVTKQGDPYLRQKSNSKNFKKLNDTFSRKRKNRKELNSFQENTDAFSNERLSI